MRKRLIIIIVVSAIISAICIAFDNNIDNFVSLFVGIVSLVISIYSLAEITHVSVALEHQRKQHLIREKLPRWREKLNAVKHEIETNGANISTSTQSLLYSTVSEMSQNIDAYSIESGEKILQIKQSTSEICTFSNSINACKLQKIIDNVNSLLLIIEEEGF